LAEASSCSWWKFPELSCQKKIRFPLPSGQLPQAFTHLALIEAVPQLIEEEARQKALSA